MGTATPVSLSRTHTPPHSSYHSRRSAMDGVSAAATWAAEDDVLLKNAIEGGASLESLAKGAVCFSRKFTLQELQDRWCSLLYDSETSALASARIIEYETVLSTSNPAKTIKLFNSKTKGFSLRKQKIDSVKNQYYAMRKRVCHEPCFSADFGYVIAPCSCIPAGSGCACGSLLQPSEGHHLVNRTDPAVAFVDSYGNTSESFGGGQHVHPKDNQNYIFPINHTNAGGCMVIDGNTNDESLHDCSDVDQLKERDYIRKNPQSTERNIASLKDLSDLQDYVHLRQPLADVSGIEMIPTSSEVPFPDCSIDCRLNTEDSEIPCNDDILIPGQAPSECTSTCDQNSQHNMCVVSSEATPPENADGSNQTDLVEGVQPSSTTVKMETSTIERKENIVALNETCIVGIKPPAIHGDICVNSASMCTSTFHSAPQFVEETACGLVQHEGFGNLRNLTLDMSIQVPDQVNCKFLADKPEIGLETAIENCISSHALPDMEFHNPIATMSTSDQAGGSDDENSVPNYFDLEALILGQDLIPWDQESDFIQPEVSRFEHLESRKELVRLEQGARSYMNRAIMSRGAFAILYGQHLKYYIKDPEVTLGRETEEVHVDIDLGKEGNANKISRRQAVIKMDEAGSFHIKNIGKFPIFVNGKEVPCNKSMKLISDALLEVRGMKFIFHANPDAVRQHIVRAIRGTSQGKNAAFDWDQTHELRL